jgi:ubiquinol-cytochrome c reductase iron-sulfur subunit
VDRLVHDPLEEEGHLMSDHHELATVDTDVEPFPDPGLPEHEPRPTDVDEAAERRAERQVASLFGLSTVFMVLFVVSYFTFHVGDNPSTFGHYGASNIALGVTFGLALLCIGVGAIQWARKLMGDHEIVEYRHSAGSSDEDKAEVLADLSLGIEESGIGRRPLIRNSLLGAVGVLGIGAIVPLWDLGPTDINKLYHTVWKKGMRVVQDVDGANIKPEDMEIGQLVNAEPELFYPDGAERLGVDQPEGVQLNVDKAKAAVILVRMQPDDIKPSKGREDWGVNGILCYSKICTHVGCPISLWEQQTHNLLCPCHQSTFDLADNGKVVFGPAARPLPQLPLSVDDDGYLAASSDFTEPVGPSFWERG